MKKYLSFLLVLLVLLALTGCKNSSKNKDKQEWPFNEIPAAEKYVNDIQEVATGKYVTINEFTKKSFLVYIAKLEREGFTCIEDYSDSNAKGMENILQEKLDANGFVVWRGTNNQKIVELHWYDKVKYCTLTNSTIDYDLKVKVWNNN